ncbi:MAG: tetratricopeptide repeat protein [Acidobacteria bacterium]|nr:tetratricopeptide repeat protein [Acidobacteriota bacterium]
MLAGSAFGQSSQAAKKGRDDVLQRDKATAYYHYSLGHMYAEMAASYNNRGDYFNKAIENYRLAIKADPGASFLSEELSDLYIQSGRLREAVSDAEDILKQNPNDLNARRILARIYARLIGDSQQNRLDEGYLRKAIEQYQKVTEKDPGDTESWLMLGRLHKLAQSSPEAEKAYKKALENDPNNEDALTGLAMVYADLGDAKQAADLLKRAADKNPTGRSLTTLASTYEQMREYALAAETLKKAIEISPANAAELKRALARDLMLSEQLDDALATYKALAAEDPKDPETQLRMSQIYRQKKDFAKAREASNKARELDPNSLEIRYNDVNLLESEGKNTEAIALLKEIVDSTAKRTYTASERGNRVVLLERLGTMYRANEQFPQAIETFKQIGETDPEMAPRGTLQIVETYRLAKDYPKAEAEAKAALAKNSGDRALRGMYASLLADQGKSDAAIAEMKKLVAEKADRETWISMAQVYEKSKRFNDMAKAIDEAEKLAQGKEEKEGITFMRGAMLEKQKRFDEAEAEFRKVLAASPDNAAALNYLGYMLADRNVRLPEALELITKALDNDPGNGAYLDSLGWVYYRLGRFPEAETQLKLALDKTSRDPTVHDHLGDVYYKQGKIREAIGQWQASLKEWETAASSEQEPVEIAKVQKKLEGAKVRLAKEGGPAGEKP